MEAPLQRRVTEGGLPQKMGGPAARPVPAALVRRATAVEEDERMLQRQTTVVVDDRGSLEEAGGRDSVRTAIVRRLTAIEDSMKEEEDEAVSVPPAPPTLNRRTIRRS